MAVAHIAWTFFGIISIFSNANCFQITLIHTNDVHSRFISYNKVGKPCSAADITNGTCWDGVARRFTALQKLRSMYRNSILLDAGDQFQGTLWYTTMKWHPIATYMNLLNYTAMTFGNHEFDDGEESLSHFIDQINFPIVSCNVNSSKSKSNYLYGKFSDYLIFDGAHIKTNGGQTSNNTWALTGVTTKMTSQLISHALQSQLDDEIQSLNVTVQKIMLENGGLNKIVVLSHTGYEAEIEMCRRVSEIDVIVGGHSHTTLYNFSQANAFNQSFSQMFANDSRPSGPYPTVVKRSDGTICLVVQASCFGKYIGVLSVEFDDEGAVKQWTGNPVQVDSSLEEDPMISELLIDSAKNVSDYELKPIAFTCVTLSSLNNVCRFHECAVANLVADSFLDYLRDKVNKSLANKVTSDWLNVNEPIYGFSIVNAGVLNWLSIDAGRNLTLGDAYNLIPYSNTLKLIIVNGTAVQKLFERSIEGYFTTGYKHGKFLHVSGAEVVYSTMRPKSTGECPENSTRRNDSIQTDVVESVRISCLFNCPTNSSLTPTEPGQKYVVSLSSFTAGGGDGNSFLPSYSKMLTVADDLLVDVFVAYVQKIKRIRSKIDGRLTLKVAEESC